MSPGEALLALFATCDDVYTEDDAFDERAVTMGYGRIYRAWKEARAVLEEAE